MPFIKVAWYAGTSHEQKSKVARGFTDVMAELGIPREAVEIVFEDVKKEDWARGGTLVSDR